MAQIPGSDGFGNVTARPRRFNEAQVPREAFGGGVGQTLTAVGDDMQRQQVARCLLYTSDAADDAPRV